VKSFVAMATDLMGRLTPVGALVAAVGCGSAVTGNEDVDAGEQKESGPMLPDAAIEAGVEAASDGGRDTGRSGDAAPEAAAVVAVPLKACPQGDYSAPVSIGGSQTFSLVLDTGSTTLGVASSACTTCDGVTPVYQPSSGATDEHMTATSQYVTGDWSGEIYQDQVATGPTASAEVKLVAIDSQKGFFETVQCGQGVVGFAPASSALSGTTGYFDQLVATRGFADVFGLELCPTGGTLWLGGYDPAVASAPLQYVPFSSSPYSSYYYVVGLSSVTVAGTTVPLASGSYTDAIVDTGTNAFVVSTAAYDAITSAIAASPGFAQVFGADAGTSFFAQSCTTLTRTRDELDAMLPPLTLTFGGNPAVDVQATATQSYLLQGGTNVWCSVIAAIDPGPSLPFDSIVGTPILQSSVVVFDRVNRRLGFAPHGPCP
jgi:hypothetical protein